eukprot:GHVU01046505.1.p1 GENE.GHVU01046505.1~~GHVU01046505.1.p1  ORF type:complete len:121 (+),score=8.05 GHVU01046505.1:330-692(+)
MSHHRSIINHHALPLTTLTRAEGRKEAVPRERSSSLASSSICQRTCSPSWFRHPPLWLRRCVVRSFLRSFVRSSSVSASICRPTCKLSQGVNGVGKSTNLAKVCFYLKQVGGWVSEWVSE